MQLCSSLSILGHYLSLGLEWNLTFSSPVATAKFSRFVDILSAALSQHHLLGFEIAQLEFHHLYQLCSLWCFLIPKAHLTSHSRMFGSRWVITPLWLSGSWRSFLNSSSVYSCHLFLTSSASVGGGSVVAQSCLTLCDPSPWNSPGQNTGVGSLSLLQRIFPTKVSHIAGTFF